MKNYQPHYSGLKIRGGVMINFDDYPILKNNMSTLKETSIDYHDKEHISYMTNSSRSAVNFDGVKSEYIKHLNLSENPKSNDALFISDGNDLVFVEFKMDLWTQQKSLQYVKRFMTVL